MMTLPLIGITTTRMTNPTPLPSDGVNEAYIMAVRNSGGLPVLIPVAHGSQDALHLAQRLDGVLLTGGGDMEPGLFNGKPHPRIYDIDPDRDRLEIELVRALIEKGVPFLGICRGCQVINVALGGSLYTHIEDQKPDALKHDYFPDFPRDHLAHQVNVKPASRLASILGSLALPVNSLHHQGIDQIALGLTATASAPDGLAEAVELSDHPFALAVQWHPEWLQQYPPMRKIFEAFTEAAGQRKR
jgi:putative glutamine amidotransferase